MVGYGRMELILLFILKNLDTEVFQKIKYAEYFYLKNIQFQRFLLLKSWGNFVRTEYKYFFSYKIWAEKQAVVIQDLHPCFFMDRDVEQHKDLTGSTHTGIVEKSVFCSRQVPKSSQRAEMFPSQLQDAGCFRIHRPRNRPPFRRSLVARSSKISIF